MRNAEERHNEMANAIMRYALYSARNIGKGVERPSEADIKQCNARLRVLLYQLKAREQILDAAIYTIDAFAKWVNSDDTPLEMERNFETWDAARIKFESLMQTTDAGLK